MITLTKDDHSVAGNIHCLQLFAFINRIRIVNVIQSLHGLMDLLLVVHVSRRKYLLPAAGMPRSSLLHELGEHSCAVALMPFRGHPRKDLLPHASSRPVWNNLLCL